MARTKEVFGALRTGHFNQERAAQLLDAADSKARIQGQQLGHRIAVGLKHNDVADRALTFVAEAGGSARKLQAFAEQIRGKNKQAEEAVQYAQENLDSLRPHSIELAKQLEKERQAEQALGIETDRLNDYMKHAYRADDVGLFDIGPGGSGVSTSFLKDRSYPDYATAIANGETPKDLRASKLLDSRVAAGQRLANRVVWGQQLKELKTASGEGFAADFVKKGGRWTAPSGYVTKELAPGVRVPIHDDYARFIDALTAPSFLRQSKAGSAALGIEAGLKHGLLIFDSYHAFRMMRKELFLSKKIAYENALSVLEYDKPTVARLVKQGDLKPEAAKWIEENRPKAELLVRNGLNVGRLSEALYAEVMRKEVKVKGVDINLPGRFNRWVFEKLTRGAMLQSALLELGKVKKAHPTWTDEQAASYIAKQMNVYYGNLQRQGLFKSESARDSLQLAFLAPQWVESMVQSEARGYGQLAKAPADAVRRRPIAPLGKALASGVVAYLVANQIINMATTGHPTWENKEDGRKFDAKLHGGYWLSPMNDVAEVTHDYYRYMNQGKGAVESTAQIAANKLSPVGRAASVLFQGRDYAGAKLSDKERLEEATKAMIPTPLPLSGLQSEVPKQGGRQAYSTLGFKVEPDYRQHEEALEKVSGKRFEDLTLDERVEAEQKYQEGRPPMSARQKQDAKQKSLDAQARRERETTGEFSKADRQWMDSRGLVLPSYDDKLALGKTKVYLTKEEQAKLKSLVFEEYKAVLDDLRSDESFDSMDRTERQQLFRVQMNAASRRARVRLQEELDRPVQKMNKTPGPFRSLP